MKINVINSENELISKMIGYRFDNDQLEENDTEKWYLMKRRDGNVIFPCSTDSDYPYNEMEEIRFQIQDLRTNEVKRILTIAMKKQLGET